MNGPVGLLFVHAFPADPSMWDDQLRGLAANGRPILAPALPGFGGTAIPAREPSLDDYADAMIRAVDEARWSRAVICGLSLGGYISFAIWRRHRDRVAGLVLADTKAEADTEPAKASRVAVAKAVREVGAEQAFFATTPPAWLRPGSPLWPSHKERVLRQPAEAIAQASLAIGGRPDSRGDLAGISVPTAVLVGDGDTLTPLENARTIADGIKGATLTVIKDAGHLANLENPAAFNAAVRDLLRRVGI